jgi:hypothetical protein
MICDAVTKLGVAGKQAFFVFMAVKAFEVLVTGGIIVYALTIILSTIRKSIASSSFCRSLTRIVDHKYLLEGELNEDAKKEITNFVVEKMSRSWKNGI